eukprot:COSAG06_NODE_57721_length_279_cov_0.866667_1_plen_59_part_01
MARSSTSRFVKRQVFTPSVPPNVKCSVMITYFQLVHGTYDCLAGPDGQTCTRELRWDKT